MSTKTTQEERAKAEEYLKANAETFAKFGINTFNSQQHPFKTCLTARVGAGKIGTPTVFNAMWSQLMTCPDNASAWLNNLGTELKRVLEYERTKRKAERKGQRFVEPDDMPQLSVGSLVISIKFIFIALQLNAAKAGKVAGIFVHGGRNNEKRMRQVLEICPELAQILTSVMLVGKSVAVDCKTLVDICTSYPSKSTRKDAPSYVPADGPYSLDSGLCERGDMTLDCFMYHVLFKDERSRQDIVTGLLRCLANQTKVEEGEDYQGARRKLIGLLQISQELMDATVLPPNSIEQIADTVHRLYYSPKPVSTTAIPMSKALIKEIRFRGYNMLRRARFDYTNAFVTSTTHPTRAVGCHVLVTQKTDAILSLLLLQNYGDVKIENNRNVPDEPLIAMLAAALKGNGGTVDVAKLKSLSHADLIAADLKLSQLEAKIYAAKTEQEATAIRNSGVHAVTNFIEAAQPGTPRELKLGGAPGFAPIQYVRHHKLAVELKEFMDQAPSAAGHIPTTCYVQLKTLLEKHRVIADGTQADVVVRVVMSGGTAQVGHLAAGYILLLQKSPELLQGIDLRFYVLPSAPNLLGGFLAAHDHWYRTNIFVPCQRDNFLLPWTRDYEADGKGSRFETCVNVLFPPAKLLTLAMDRYVLDSRSIFNLQLFEVHVFKTDTSTPHLRVPFFSNLDIGVRCSAFKHATTQARAIHARALDEAVNKAVASASELKFKAVTLSLEVKQVHNLGHNYSAPVVAKVKTVAYHQLVFSNLQNPGDGTCPSDPTTPRLELFARATNSGLGLVGKALGGRKATVLSATVTAPDNSPFDILVDNRLISGCHSIVITPATTSDGTPVQLPISTRSPIYY